MKPESISIKNYKSYGDEETKLDLGGEGVKLIYGDIGAGKTTFVDAIIWVLYGETLVNQDEVINRQINKNCKVEYNFYIQNSYYSIVRYRKHEVNKDGVLIFKDHKNISPNKKKDAQELINEIIGINHKAIINSILFSSEIYTSFLRVTPGKRLEIIESVLNLKKFQKWSEAIKTLKKPIEEELQVAKENKSKLEYGIETVNGNINEYKQGVKNTLEKLKKEKEELHSRREEIEDSLEKYADINIEEELDKLSKAEEVEELNRGIKTEIERVTKELDSLEYELNNKSKKFNEVKEKVKEIEKIDFSNELEKINKKENDDKLKEKINTLYSKKEDTTNYDKQLKELKKEIEELEKNYNSTSDNVCYTCGQEIDKEIKERLEKEIEEKRGENSKKEQYILAEKNEVLEKNNKIDEEIKNINEQIEGVSVKYSREELDSFKEQLSSLKIQEATLSGEVSSLNEKVSSLKDELNKQKDSLHEEYEKTYSYDFLMDIGSKLEGLKLEKQEIAEQIEKINEKAKNAYDKSYIESLKKKITKIEGEIKKQEEIIKNKEDEIYYYNYLLKIFSNKDFGVKKYIISKMIDIFNKNINKYIPIFFDRKIEVLFNKNLEEEIKENNEEISFASFSSGEKTLLDVAVAFSLFKLVKDFFSSEVKFLAFDEILDRNLDENGINAILQIIEEMSKENSILVISHRGEYKENFQHKIRVYKEDGFSRLNYE